MLIIPSQSCPCNILHEYRASGAYNTPILSEPLISSGTTIRILKLRRSLDAYIANRLANKVFRPRTFLLCLPSANPDSATRSKLLCIRKYDRYSIAIFIDWISQVRIIDGAGVLYTCISESSACKGTALNPDSQHDIQPRIRHLPITSSLFFFVMLSVNINTMRK